MTNQNTLFYFVSILFPKAIDFVYECTFV